MPRKILVAVHGIGAQQRSATGRSVATRMACSTALGTTAFAPEPLGYFHSSDKTRVQVAAADGLGANWKYGVAEVFWADLPKAVVEEKDTLEEIKAWGQTLAARARETFLRSNLDTQYAALAALPAGAERTALERGIAEARNRAELAGPDFALASEVIEEIVETLRLLENLSWIAEKAGLMKFDVRAVLEEFVGDVQLVAEFTYHRQEIVGRFHRAMADLYAEELAARDDDFEFHIVAHSEGTVVAFLGLLHALCGQTLVPPGAAAPGGIVETVPPLPGWVEKVRGFMTIGSPIDKHLLLWNRLTRDIEKSYLRRTFKGLAPGMRVNQIRWRNYYDRGDPVGFDLDTARAWLKLYDFKEFEFCGCAGCGHDQAFSRYYLPGKAHNDYWDDEVVFEHFLRNVVNVNPAAPLPDPPDLIPNGKVARVVSPTIPYLACAALLTLGTWILYKAVTHFLHPGTTEMQRYVQLMVGGTLPEARPAEGWTLFLNSFGLAALIAGTSLAARLPRLALGMKFRAVGAWIIGAELYVIFVDGASAEAIGQGVCRHLEKLGVAQWAEARGWRLTAYELAILATLLGSLLVAGIALWATRRASGGLRGHAERRLRCFFKGSRPLLLLGAALIALFVLSQVPKDHPAAAPPAAPPAPVEERVRRKTAPLSPEERQAAAQKRAADERKAQATLKALEVSPPVWPVVLSSAAFFYLWWLALLLFDLAFVWNRYVRQGVALERLRSWKPLGATATANPKARCARWSKEDGRSGKPAATA